MLVTVHPPLPLHPRTVAQTEINKHEHTEPGCGCYLRSIRGIFTVRPIAVMRLQPVSEIQPGFIEPKEPLTSCQCQPIVYLPPHISNIVYPPSRSRYSRNKHNNVRLLVFPEANPCRRRPFCLVYSSLSLPDDSSNASRSGVRPRHRQRRRRRR